MGLASFFRTVLRLAGGRSHFLGEPATDRGVTERAPPSAPYPKVRRVTTLPRLLGVKAGFLPLSSSVANMEHHSQHHLHHEQHSHHAHMWLEGDVEQQYGSNGTGGCCGGGGGGYGYYGSAHEIHHVTQESASGGGDDFEDKVDDSGVFGSGHCTHPPLLQQQTMGYGTE